MTRPSIGERFARVPLWVWFALALVLQLGIIGSMVVTHYASVNAGQPVRLRIQPVDPRDPLRGDYLTFTYDISALPRTMFRTVFAGARWTPTEGQVVYVPLVNTPTYWQAVEPVARKLPAPRKGSPEPGSAYIRGVVTAVDSESVHIKYGIEEYFVPEGKGASFPLRQSASALVMVAPDGVAHLKQVYVDGKAWP